MKVILSERWSKEYPRAGVGILAMSELVNPKSDVEVERMKRGLEVSLRERYAVNGKASIRALPVLQAYSSFYKKYGKSYHVQLQTESVALQDKSLPSVSTLVDTMFVAELKNGLLTAGHDLNAVQPPVTIEVARGTESYTLMNGKNQTLKAGDLCMTDAAGVISSVLNGPDARTRITANTTAALFVVYAPEGITRDAVMQHLEEIQDGTRRFAPGGETILLDVFGFQ